MKIIPADQRLADHRGAKMLIVGPTGVGKTSLLRTVDLKSTLFIDIEAGDLAVQDLAVDTLRPRTWPECRDLAVALAGANPAVPADACYSAGTLCRGPGSVRRSRAARPVHDLLRRQHHRRRPPVLRLVEPAAGSLLRSHRQEGPARRLRTARARNARVADAPAARARRQRRSSSASSRPSPTTSTGSSTACSSKAPAPGASCRRSSTRWSPINWIDFGDGVLTRSFVCTSPNRWHYPAKDRSGRLDQLEEPHLGKLIDKLTRPGAAASSRFSQPLRKRSEEHDYDYNKQVNNAPSTLSPTARSPSCR